MTQLTDPELAKQIQNSDAEAFKILYDQYSEALFHFLWSKTGNSETANDLVQEVFVRLWNMREKLNTRKTLKSLLFRMAQNAAIDLHRKQKIRISYAKAVETENVQGNEKLSEDNIIIKMALDKLPEKNRSVFIMHHIQKYTYLEIATLCGVSKKTVEKRMKKAIVMLQKLLMLLT